MDMRFVKCNVRSLYRAGSPITVAKEISKYKLVLDGQGMWHEWGRRGMHIGYW
jgi:hypothetical protein